MKDNHMPSQHAFPWGVYIGDLLDDNDTLPVCLDSEQGGFCVLFDDDSEHIANNFIENIALKLFEVLPDKAICVDIFDFSYRKRFQYLSELQNDQLYQIARHSNEASSQFNQLEKIVLHRHHDLLSVKTTNLSQYNQNTEFTEQYHLLLINLDHYPDDITSFQHIRGFLDSAYDAGFYCIAFAHQKIIDREEKVTQAVLERFPLLYIQDKQCQLTPTLFKAVDLVQGYDFESVNDNKDLIIETLLARLQQPQENEAQDFLSLPIGTSNNGRNTLHFSLGDKSKAYHAFIAGVAGSGKTTLLNNLILGIAENYTSDEIRLYLMDYKRGVEFQVFKQHPNCEKIFLDNEDRQASIDLLEQFVDTIRQRSEQFTDNGVKDISDYNQQAPQQPMHRIVLIIDEVHRLFVGNYQQKEHFSDLLKEVVRQGRAFGVHIILSTQTLAGTQIDSELMSQITLRISYKLTHIRDSETIFSYGNTRAVELGQYEIIYNADAGNKNANVLARADPPQKIKSTLKRIIASRDKRLILQPEIISSVKTKPNKVTKVKNAQPEKTQQEPPRDNQYSTSEDKALLDRLIKQEAICAPQGYQKNNEAGDKA
jgi:nucleoside-triphosphatase THEP1